VSRLNNIIYGLHSVLALAQKNSQQIDEILIQEKRKDRRVQEILQLAKQKQVRINFVTHSILDNLCETKNHQGIIAKVKQVANKTECDLMQLLDELKAPAFLLIIDGVQDPHNLGACLRTADAAGVHAVIVPQDRATGLTPVVRKVASGAAENIPFIPVPNLVRTINKLQEMGIWLVGADDQAKTSIFTVDLTGPIAIVVGAEGTGLRRLTKQHCDYLAHIPMAGSVASLNVSVATGVCLFETVRQRE
jgi:23S rRNA (guanosine2251-2'-O)-methyltransferase